VDKPPTEKPAENKPSANKPSANKQLAVSVIGPDRAGLIRDLSKIVTDAAGNILESRMIALGSEFAILMLVSGNWHSVEKIRKKLDALQSRGEMTVTIRDSAPRTQVVAAPYVIDVVSLDHEGIVLGLSNFFAARKLEIAELNTRRYNVIFPRIHNSLLCAKNFSNSATPRTSTRSWSLPRAEPMRRAHQSINTSQ